jgi:3-oxoacyl-[acyl-carrier-protein] synthase-1
VVSNACVSGVMAIAVAKNMIQAGKYKDAFVIAGDEISEFVISGFNSFQAIGTEPCKPYDKNRNGINIGEAAAVYITSEPPKTKNSDLKYWEILPSMMPIIFPALQEQETDYMQVSKMQ